MSNAVASDGVLRDSVSSVWIASGLAKIPAIYGASLVQKLSGKPSRFVSSLDYARNPKLSCLPILVSLRGAHADSVSVAAAIVSRKCNEAILLTADRKGNASQTLECSSTATSVTSIGLPDRDGRFVNCKSIFVLSSLAHRLVVRAFPDQTELNFQSNQFEVMLGDAQKTAEEFIEKISRLDDWPSKQVIVLSDGLPSELAITWQSIFSEAGICTPTCFDIKDYTHGDHLASGRIGNAIYIVLSHNGIGDICTKFANCFSQLFPVVLVNLRSNQLQRFWENLVIACNVASGLTSLLGYANSRPPKHPVLKDWRDWGAI